LSPQEEPIDESDRQFEISSGSTTLASTQPVIAVSCTPERNEIPLSECDNFFVNINLKAIGSSTAATKVPMDIVCVLDNSGSMSGSKLDSVKEASKI